jgi:3-deoxy-D-manno-octulosonic-acid transferase
LKKKRIPVFLVSARFRDDQAFFHWWGKWYRKFLSFFTHIFVQDEHSRELLNQLHLNNVTVSGDTRFDRVYEIAGKSKEYPGVELFKQNKKILIAGSTWEKDEEILLDYINKNEEDLKFILAPHEINKKKIYRLVSAIESPVVRFTDEDKSAYPQAKVMIIDTIGHLSSVYKYGDIAYIGGGFGKGIHNILEAATYNLPVIFGPNYQKFSEAVEMIELKAAYSINDFEEFNRVLSNMVSDDKLRKQLSKTAGNYVKSKIGSTNLIFDKSLSMIFKEE